MGAVHLWCVPRSSQESGRNDRPACETHPSFSSSPPFSSARFFSVRNERGKTINMATLKLRPSEANVTKTCSDNLDSVSQGD